MSTTDTIILVSGVLLGAVVGSFANVCIYRLPRECMSILHPRSRCNSCLSPIRWFDNIPVVSYIILGGRCRRCGDKISIRYPLVEILTATLFGILTQKYLLPFREICYYDIGIFLGHIYLVVSLVISTFIDFEWRIIPDEVTLTGIVAAPIASAFFPGIHLERAHLTLESEFLWHVSWWTFCPVFACMLVMLVLFWKEGREGKPTHGMWKKALMGVLIGIALGIASILVFGQYMFEKLRTGALLSSLLGIFVGGGFVYILGVVGKLIFRKEAMGFGDVKLMAMVGGFIGWDGAILAIFVAAFLGAVFGIASYFITKDRYIPFGPYLSMGTLVCMFFEIGFLDLPELIASFYTT